MILTPLLLPATKPRSSAFTLPGARAAHAPAAAYPPPAAAAGAGAGGLSASGGGSSSGVGASAHQLTSLIPSAPAAAAWAYGGQHLSPHAHPAPCTGEPVAAVAIAISAAVAPPAAPAGPGAAAAGPGAAAAGPGGPQQAGEGAAGALGHALGHALGGRARVGAGAGAGAATEIWKPGESVVICFDTRESRDSWLQRALTLQHVRVHDLKRLDYGFITTAPAFLTIIFYNDYRTHPYPFFSPPLESRCVPPSRL